MKPETRKKTVEREVDKAWESWSHLLYSRLVQFDHFLEAIQSDLSAAGLPLHKSGQFLTDRIIEINEQIQKNKTKKVI